jgi:hypothetical protein
VTKTNETKSKLTCFCLMITNPWLDFTFEDLLIRFERIKWRTQKSKNGEISKQVKKWWKETLFHLMFPPDHESILGFHIGVLKTQKQTIYHLQLSSRSLNPHKNERISTPQAHIEATVAKRNSRRSGPKTSLNNVINLTF